MVDKITSFEQLHVWQGAIELAVKVYQITNQFPESEQFGLTSQIKRSSSSVSANIAEGFGRQGKNDKRHFNNIAYGSLLETKSFLYLSNKLRYITNEQLASLLEDVGILQKQILAFNKSIRGYEKR